jgi:hypothetical protein
MPPGGGSCCLLLLAAGCRLHMQVLAIEPEGEGGVMEYSTAFINVSWVDTALQVFSFSCHALSSTALLSVLT